MHLFIDLNIPKIQILACTMWYLLFPFEQTPSFPGLRFSIFIITILRNLGCYLLNYRLASFALASACSYTTLFMWQLFLISILSHINRNFLIILHLLLPILLIFYDRPLEPRFIIQVSLTTICPLFTHKFCLLDFFNFMFSIKLLFSVNFAVLTFHFRSILRVLGSENVLKLHFPYRLEIFVLIDLDSFIYCQNRVLVVHLNQKILKFGITFLIVRNYHFVAFDDGFH